MPNVTTSASFSSEALVALRKSQGLSRSELARRADLDRTQVWRIETGVAVPYDSTVGRLARALSVPVSALLADAA
jgi:transcriptional regulator with XRE-family HTH domain